MSAALDRIEASRARLRLALLPPLPPVRQIPFRQSWWTRLKAFPTVAAVSESVDAWWNQHPLRPVAQVAGEASNAVVKPLAQRKPLTLVLAASAVGAAVAWTRPWRWVLRSALFAGLVPRLATRIVASLPLESWMRMATTALSRRAPPNVRQPAAAAPDRWSERS